MLSEKKSVAPSRIPPFICPTHGKDKCETYVQAADKWTASYECGCVVISPGSGDTTISTPLQERDA